jgi:hypothetical protein
VTELATNVSYWLAPATGGTLTIPVGQFGQWWVSILDNNDSWNTPGGVDAFVELDFGTSSGLANAGSIVYPLVNGVNIEDAQTSFGATVLNVDSVHRSYYLVDVQVVDFGGGTGVAGMATGTPEPGSASTLGIGLVLLLAGGKLANRGRTPEGCRRAAESLRART